MRSVEVAGLRIFENESLIISSNFVGFSTARNLFQKPLEMLILQQVIGLLSKHHNPS